MELLSGLSNGCTQCEWVVTLFRFFCNGKGRRRTAASASVRGSSEECGVSVPLFSDSDVFRRQMHHHIGPIGRVVPIYNVLVDPFYEPRRSEEPAWRFQIQRWGLVAGGIVSWG
ncbi:uncharacterized protein HKW66_Vig0014710 [Vigna angularis]|uniref:Uncharacterized protein n=1 Tax=Phaseolus angularis TaxID=3914 RepID=A0A8T0LF45_PHAAN|nr:uncharacterized protein HKW66_Vig0014710 [Vigna angularis]